jgi:hypothetical protein
MAISNAELTALFGIMGCGIVPLTGGPAGTLKSPIAQTTLFQTCRLSSSLTSGVMNLTSICIPSNQVITNINYVSQGAESSGTHLWFALYDDGRGSSTAGQLALLGQTADQTGATAFTANTNLGLSLLTPYTTTYSGIYYVAIMCVASVAAPSITATGGVLNASIQISSSSTGAILAGTAGSGLTTNAPNPSGAISLSTSFLYAYLS